jgi:hypothetical protein
LNGNSERIPRRFRRAAVLPSDLKKFSQILIRSMMHLFAEYIKKAPSFAQGFCKR